MKTLDNLVRLSRWQVDEKRRTLADLERFRDDLNSQIVRLATEMAVEEASTTADPLVATTYSVWLAATLRRRDTLMLSLAAAEARVVEAQEAVGEAFREQKRYEQVLEARTKRERDLRLRREAAMMDEAGLEGFRRRQTAGA